MLVVDNIVIAPEFSDFPAIPAEYSVHGFLVYILRIGKADCSE
jgi:hypothetical protein